MYRQLLTLCGFAVAAVCMSPLFAQERSPIANWNFDGDLLDRSGHGNDAFGESAAFTAGHSGQETVTLRFQNHTHATRMRLRFTTKADSVWDDAKSQIFDVVADDNSCRTYRLDMSAVRAWQGSLQQLRLDLGTGEPVTGTCRFDYVWITRPQTE